LGCSILPNKPYPTSLQGNDSRVIQTDSNRFKP
jgi:hypothetical protein